MLNGERLPTGGGGEGTGRDVPLDILPANFLQRIEVSKTLSPDMEADAIGGAINYITSTAPSKRILDLDLGIGYHGQSQKTIQNGNLTFGDKLGNFGYMVSGAWYNRNWGSDNFELVYDIDATEEARANGTIGEDYAYASRLELRDYTGRRRTAGLNWGAEYEFNPMNKIYLRGMYSDFQDNEIRRQTEYKWTSNDIEQNLTHAIYHTRLYGGDLGGEHRFANGSRLEWKAAYWDNKYDYKSPNEEERNDTTAGYYIAEFEQDDVVFDNLEENGLYLVGPDNNENIQPGVSSSTPANINNMGFSKAESYGTLIKEIDKVFKIDYSLPFGSNVDFKTGAKVRLKHRNYFRKYATWRDTTGTIRLSEFSEDFDYNGGFLTELGSPYDNLILPTPVVSQMDELVKDQRVERTVSRQTSNYEGSENFYAFYAMSNIRFSPKLSALLGFRYEFIALEYEGIEVVNTEEGSFQQAKTTNSSSGVILPNLQFKYAVNNNMNLRLAATRGLGRAEFNRLSPNDVVNASEGENSVTRGNPDLKPVKTWNFDVLGEYFFDDVGIISGGVFYKIIEDYPNRTTFMEGNTEVTTWDDNGDGYLAGFELGFQKRLSFLPGLLNGLGIEGNYTYADSKVKQIREGNEYEGRLQNQPKHTANGGLFYEKYGFAIRTALHFKGAYIAEFQGPVPEIYDRWYDKNLHLSINASYNITEKIKFYAEVSELLNSPLRYYHGNVGLPEQIEFYSFRGMVGLRMSIF
jgi:TonB-dependent receptor